MRISVRKKAEERGDSFPIVHARISQHEIGIIGICRYVHRETGLTHTVVVKSQTPRCNLQWDAQQWNQAVVSWSFERIGISRGAPITNTIHEPIRHVVRNDVIFPAWRAHLKRMKQFNQIFITNFRNIDNFMR